MFGAVAVGVGIQFVPVRDVGTNPPHRFKLDAPPEVEALMRRACFDCHSNETRWPLYSRLAPGSWLMSRDIHNGRNHINFSEWGDVDEDERQDDLENAWEQVESGEMPPWFYILPFTPRQALRRRQGAPQELLPQEQEVGGEAEGGWRRGGGQRCQAGSQVGRQEGRVGPSPLSLRWAAARPPGPGYSWAGAFRLWRMPGAPLGVDALDGHAAALLDGGVDRLDDPEIGQPLAPRGLGIAIRRECSRRTLPAPAPPDRGSRSCGSSSYR